MAAFFLLLTFSLLDFSHGSQFILSTVGNKASVFNNKTYVKKAGYTHVGASNLMLCVSYAWLSPKVFPNGSDAEAWRQQCVAKAQAEIKEAHDAGLKTNHGMDVFIFPTTLVKLYPNMTNPKTGAIALTPMTKYIIAGMIDEALALFPTADSMMIRVGENYLPHNPYFTGNQAVDFNAPFDVQQQDYVDLIQIMKAGIIDKYNKTFVVRTWDTSGFSPSRPKRFHSSLAYYLNVTNRIDPNPKLIFSIKHVMLDFWRYVAFNPSLTMGKHQQIIEVECAREYEGKGAMPNYIGHGVINHWSEVTDGKGLKDVVNNSLITGIWLWSSGGGWGGVPDVGVHEVWPKLNTLVILRWWRSQTQPGHNPLVADAAFLTSCQLDFGIQSARCPALLRAALLSQDAILQTRYCAAYDRHLDNQFMPTNNWLRDDRLGGLAQLNGLDYGTWPVFKALYGNATLTAAVDEKYAAISTWADVKMALTNVTQGDTSDWAQYLSNSAEYGYRLAHYIAAGWKTMAIGYSGNATGVYNKTVLAAAINEYDHARVSYNKFVAQSAVTATPFHPYYEDVSGHATNITHAPGLNATIDGYRSVLHESYEA